MSTPNWRFATFAITALALVASACGGGDEPPPGTATAAPIATIAPTAVPTEQPTQISPYSLPTREVPFVLAVPAGTSGPVSVRVFGASPWEIARSVELSPAADGTWTGSVALEEGALVRYVYDRGNLDDFDSLTARREAAAIDLETTWRVVHVAPELTEVRDTVAMWADARGFASTGEVRGVVTDAVSGDPVIDAEVSVAGIHTATDYDGSYRLDVPAGEHVVTIYRATGDYLAVSRAVTVPANNAAFASFDVTPARPLTVQIQAILPEDLPVGAVVKVYGPEWQTGGRFSFAPGVAEGLRLPVTKVARGRDGERVQIALDLHEGQQVTYRYTIAGPGLSSEIRLDGDPTARSFIARRSERVRVDEIEAFRPEGAVEVVLRATVPDNTPEDVPVQFVMGPSHWMNLSDSGYWSTVLYARPGEELSYALRLGDAVELGADASPDQIAGSRTLEVPDVDTAFGVRVTDWVGRAGVSALPEGDLATVRFRVTVPAATTEGATLRLVGNGELKEGIELTPAAGNPTLFEGNALLPAGRYTYDIRKDDGGEEPVLSAEARKLQVTLTDHVVNDWVIGWAGEIPNVRPRDVPFQGGFYLPDFWSPGFVALTEPTFDAIADHEGALVTLSSVWSYGQVRPEPTVESRPLRAGSVATPLEELREQAREARSRGLPVVLAPQFNMEMTNDGAALAGLKSQQWIDGWLREAERMWLWNAEAADEIGADTLLLPGPTFHVFDGPGSFPSQQSFEEFDASLTALVAEVRERFDGQLVISGAQTSLETPGTADLVGVTTFDTGHPGLAASASVEDWRRAYEAQFEARLDPIYEAWEVPIVFYQMDVPARPGFNDPTGEYAQARQLEGMLQALAHRTWVVSALTWSFEMVEAPETAAGGVRGRLAEAVLLKHFALFEPGSISALTVS